MSETATATETGPTPAAVPYPSAGRGWFLVAMLTIAYVFSFVDRYVLGLLIEPIKADLGLTDEDIGLIMGPAFAILYATTGVPIGWLVDRARRTWIVAAGVAVWSLATAASGFARNFWQLFVARMTVGVGEATLSPSAFSMIADSFPPERRGKPIAFYTAALSLGAGIASLITAAVLVWAKTVESVDVPALGPMAPWQLTFLAVGLPGLIVAGFFLFIREPERRIATASDETLTGNGFRDAFGYIWRHIGVFGGFVSLVCVMTIVAYSQGFLPATFDRTWGWAPEYYAAINGIALLVIGPATTLLMGYVSDRWTQAGRRDAPFRLAVIGVLILVPSGIVPYFMPNGTLAYAILCINTVGIGIVSAVGVTALLIITPAQIRGQVVALYYMAISLSGLFLGPSTVGFLSTRVFGEENIRWAMAALPALYGIIPMLFIPAIARAYREQMKRIGTDAD